MKSTTLKNIVPVIIGLVVIVAGVYKYFTNDVRKNIVTNFATTEPGSVQSTSVKYKDARKIGDTNLYLYQDERSAVPKLIYEYEIKNETLNQRIGGLSFVKNEEVFKTFEPISETLVLDKNKGLLISGNGYEFSIDLNELKYPDLSFVVNLSGEESAGAELIKKIETGSSSYFLMYTFFNRPCYMYRGNPGTERRIYLLRVNQKVQEVINEYPYSICKYIYGDGTTGVSYDKDNLVFSNGDTVMYFSYEYPEWGFITRELQK